MSEPALSPQQEREARIAELRARRRARARWLATRSLLSIVVLSVLAALLLYFLFNTLRGRDVLLRQIVDRLPEGDELTWSSAEGPASGPMTLHDLRYVHRGCPDRDGEPVAWPGCKTALLTVFTAKRAVIDPTLRPLLGRKLQLEALGVSGATLLLPESNEPFELPRWPESLPAIAPPLALEADAIAIDDLQVLRATAPQPTSIVRLQRVRGGLAAEDGRLHLERVVADTDRGRFTVHGVTRDVSAQAQIRWIPASDELRAQGITGDLIRAQATFTVNLPDHNVSVNPLVRLKVSDQIRVNVTIRAVSS